MSKKTATGFYRRVTAGLNESLQEYLDDLGGEPCRDLHKTTLAVVEEQLFRFVLAHHKGNLSAAAKTLGISRTTLGRKIRVYGIGGGGAGRGKGGGRGGIVGGGGGRGK